MTQTKSLRRRVLQPMATVFCILWLGTMAMYVGKTYQEKGNAVNLEVGNARQELERIWDRYTEAVENGTDDDLARNDMQVQLNELGWYTIRSVSGASTFFVRDEEGRALESAVAWAQGQESKEGESWYLDLDGGLSDEEQVRLAQWVQETRGEYYIRSTLYPKGEPDAYDETDGTVARVTGIPDGAYRLKVTKLELLHPDGSVETVVTEDRGEGETVTLQLPYLTVSSALTSPQNGKTRSEGTLKRRLADYRATQELLQEELSGEEFRHGGYINGTFETDGQLARLGTYKTHLPATVGIVWGGTLILAIVLMLVLSAYLSRRVTGPVKHLCGEMKNEEPCSEETGIEELNVLAKAFNEAREKVKDDLRREQDMTRAAAHELKTPLAVLRSHAEALREDIAPEKRERYLDILMEECDRMDALVKELLDLSRLEGGGVTLKKEPVRLDECAKETFDRIRESAERKGCRVELDLAPVTAPGDRKLLLRATENYASNALRHCREGGAIRVRTGIQAGKAVLCVENDGENVPEEELGRLFETFYRGDAARSRDKGGSGLGLAIVRSIMALHGGTCRAENLPDGMRFTLELEQEA